MSSLRNIAARARGLEIISAPIIPVDENGDPVAACPACGAPTSYREPGSGWRCSQCSPPILPPIERQAGWAFCGLPA